jgi:hypothetical protein
MLQDLMVIDLSLKDSELAVKQRPGYASKKSTVGYLHSRIRSFEVQEWVLKFHEASSLA